MHSFRKLFSGFSWAAALLLAGLCSPGAAYAANLRIGLASEVSSLDPHYLNIASNIAFSSHVFDALVHVDPNGKLVPGLAESWQVIDPTTWEFKLRRGVKFHDGSELTAQDVIFSLDRPATLTASPGPFTSYTRQITGKQAPDAHTLRLKTAAPYGPLPLDLSTIFIVSRKAAQSAGTDDFNSGKAMIGTGPFKFSAFRRGDAIDVVRNDSYWGEKAAWDKVTFRMLGSGAPRMAALLAGDVDAIESVPPADLARIKANPKFALAQKTSWRTIFWHLDHQGRSARYITDKAGKPLPANPLRDARVRHAFSLAINRQALTERTLEGLATPAGNLVAPGIFGYNDAVKPDAYDPAAAKKLLTEAGYPDGFAMTIHGPNDRYINDAQVVQTMAQFLNRIGIKTTVETMPLSVYFSRARSGEFSFALLGWGTLAGDFGLRTLLGTPNPDTGWGSWNWGKYSNPALDNLIRSALASTDQAKRENFAREGAALALRDHAIIPMYHQLATWAMRKGLIYTARTDEFTFAHQFRPQ